MWGLNHHRFAGLCRLVQFSTLPRAPCADPTQGPAPIYIIPLAISSPREFQSKHPPPTPWPALGIVFNNGVVSTIRAYLHSQFCENLGGTLSRHRNSVSSYSAEDISGGSGVGVVAKDVTLDPCTGVYVRIYVPRPVQAPRPVVMYIHGGAFCTQSAASPTYHNYVLQLAAQSNTICVSVSYRLAPEHRLPAAYDDCFCALQWLRNQAELSAEGSSDPWLGSAIADFSNCFLAGDSAGVNIIHELGIRAGCDGTDWLRGGPLSIRGVILVHPYFWGKARIEYEPDDSETFHDFVRDTNNQWKLCLSEGEDFDYGPCNPVGPRGYPLLPTVVYSEFLVVIAGKDPRRHRALLYRNAIFNVDGKRVSTLEQKNVDHDYQLQVNVNSPEYEKQKAREMMQTISEFIKNRSTGTR